MSQAESAIDQFRKGVTYQPPPTAFMQQGQLLDKELPPFGPALLQESADVREQIVRLLADAGKRTDHLYRIGGQLIRQPHIITLLAREGLAKNDLGREAALSALQLYVPAELLKPYGKILSADLEKWPGTTAFLLIAKVKPAEAAPVVQKLIITPRWQEELNARIAAAALGDEKIEKEFLDAFQSETDPKEKARLAKNLGWIGTDSALRMLAGALRTDMVIEMPRVMRRSVRLDVLAGLSYNFPDQQVLFENQILNDNSYGLAEAFCEQRFGTKWDFPRPPFLTIMGYPVPMPPTPR